MRVGKYLAALCIVLSMSAQPVFAQSAQLSNKIQVLNETKFDIQTDFASISNNAWTYTYDDKNNIRLKNADGSYYVNGVGPDGYIYDENGIRVNTIEYIGNKYYGKVKNAADNELIKFDTEQEAELFAYWFAINYCQQQNWKYQTINLKNGGIGIVKSDIWKYAKNSDDSTISSKVDEIISSIPADASTHIKINHAQRLVESCFEYDETATGLSMADAIKAKRGVCFHSAKLLRDVLDKLGIKNSIVFGTLNNGRHCWNQCYVDDLQKTIMLDATNVSRNDVVVTYSLNPELFYSAYKEATVNFQGGNGA